MECEVRSDSWQVNHLRWIELFFKGVWEVRHDIQYANITAGRHGGDGLDGCSSDVDWSLALSPLLPTSLRGGNFSALEKEFGKGVANEASRCPDNPPVDTIFTIALAKIPTHL